MVRLLEKPELYVTVSRDLSAITEQTGNVSVESLDRAIGRATRLLRAGATVVIDEFQRLPERFWQLLATAHPEGRLILIASSLGVVERVFGSHSPLLGLVHPVRVGRLRAADTVASLLPRSASPRAAILWAVLLSEPWLCPYVSIPLRGEPWSFISTYGEGLAGVAHGLVGEVFTEEERSLTKLYRAVLSLLGRGVWRADEIAASLYRRGLTASPSPGSITGILDKMARMGLVSRTPLWRTRRYRTYYRHESPLLAVLYGLEARLGLGERPVPRGEAEAVARELVSRELQFFLGELMAERHGGVQAYTVLPGGAGDINIVVLDSRARRALAAYEAKTGACTRRDASAARERAQAVGAGRAGLICLGGYEGLPPRGVEVLGPVEVARVAVGLVAGRL